MRPPHGFSPTGTLHPDGPDARLIPGDARHRNWQFRDLPPNHPLATLPDWSALAAGLPHPQDIPMALDYIRIRGARTHNLKNIDLDLRVPITRAGCMAEPGA